MLRPRIKLERALYDRVKTCAEAAGYATVEEFVVHALERQIAHLEAADPEEEVRKRLQGLGYIS